LFQTEANRNHGSCEKETKDCGGGGRTALWPPRPGRFPLSQHPKKPSHKNVGKKKPEKRGGRTEGE